MENYKGLKCRRCKYKFEMAWNLF